MSSPFSQPDPFQPGKVPPQPFGPPANFASGNFTQPSPYAAPGPYGPYSGPPKRHSFLALASAVLGGGGLLSCCCVFLAMPASLLAVITGHMALIFINRADSNLTGKPAAAIGLICGYLGLLLSGGVLAMGLMAGKDEGAVAGPRPVTASSLLDDVENKIRTDSGGVAHGNSDEATELAKTYSELILELREEMFTKREGGISLSGGKFITYCELRPGQCAFVVHVPEYRKFEDVAKESLAELAWQVAQRTVHKKLQPGDKLAVGLKGVLLYGSVMTGQVADPDAAENAPLTDGDHRDDLLPFFQPVEPAANAPSAPPDAADKLTEPAVPESAVSEPAPPTDPK